MIKQLALLLGCMAFLCGCVSFEYEGGTEAASPEEVVVYRDASDIRKTYRVFGRGSASGDYSEVSRDRLLTRLKDEARDRGADAILITGQMVMPKSQVQNVSLRFDSAADFDEGAHQKLQRDVDLNYGRYRGTPENVTTSARFVRIIKAEFLKYSDGAVQTFEVVEPGE